MVSSLTNSASDTDVEASISMTRNPPQLVSAQIVEDYVLMGRKDTDGNDKKDNDAQFRSIANTLPMSIPASALDIERANKQTWLDGINNDERTATNHAAYMASGSAADRNLRLSMRFLDQYATARLVRWLDDLDSNGPWQAERYDQRNAQLADETVLSDQSLNSFNTELSPLDSVCENFQRYDDGDPTQSSTIHSQSRSDDSTGLPARFLHNEELNQETGPPHETPCVSWEDDLETDDGCHFSRSEGDKILGTINHNLVGIGAWYS